MTATYYVTLTDHGAERVAQAHGQAQIVLVNLVLGDANGLPYDPVSKKTRTNLVNPRASVPVQSVVVDGNIARVTATIDSSIGGFNIHELGLTDASGQLVYIGNYHGGFKPVLANGASGELVLLIDIKADAGSQVLIQVDPTVVTANKQWVLDNFVLLNTYNAHVTQNQLEHNNLAALIAAEAQARANADYAEEAARQIADNTLNQKIDFVASSRRVFAFEYLQDTPYVASQGAASGNFVHSVTGPEVSLGNCLTNPYLVRVAATPDYDVGGITLGHSNNKTGFLLKFVGFLQVGCFAEQGDTGWGPCGATLHFYDEYGNSILDLPLGLSAIAGGFTNNSNVGHVTFRINNEYDLYPLFKSNGSIPSNLRVALQIQGNTDSDGGSTARSVLSVEKFSISCIP